MKVKQGKKKNIKKDKILFLFEGDTEKEFYDEIFQLRLPKGSRIQFIHLCGFIKTNNKGVAHEIDKYLRDSKYKDEENIHVFIAYDREGPLGTELNININLLRNTFVRSKSRIRSINEIVATQDLESWLFIDIEGIYNFLKTQKSKRAPHKYKTYTKFHNKNLSDLFSHSGKEYRKGKRVEGFIKHLDLEKILSNCDELKIGIDLLVDKCR